MSLVPDVLTPERASMRKQFWAMLKEMLDLPATNDFVDLNGVVYRTKFIDSLAGLLGYLDRPSAFWEIECTDDGFLYGRRAFGRGSEFVMARSSARATLYLLAVTSMVPGDAREYLLSLLPKPEPRLTEWRKIWRTWPADS